MHRLFVAIRPPAIQRAWLRTHMTGVTGARWQDDDQLHITLRFIGEVDGPCAQDIADTLRNIRFAPLELTFQGVGQFDRKGMVDTLWAGVTPREPLTHLHRKVDRACVTLGLPPERRAYVPHITLARFGRHGGVVEPFLARHASLNGAPFRIDSFGLFESVIGHAGAAYHLIERYTANA